MATAGSAIAKLGTSGDPNALPPSLGVDGGRAESVMSAATSLGTARVWVVPSARGRCTFVQIGGEPARFRANGGGICRDGDLTPPREDPLAVRIARPTGDESAAIISGRAARHIASLTILTPAGEAALELRRGFFVGELAPSGSELPQPAVIDG